MRIAVIMLALVVGCRGGAETSPDSGAPDSGAPDSGAADSGAADSGAPDSGSPDSGAPDSGTPDAGATDGGITVPSAFYLETIATVGGAREMVALPGGDLLVATGGAAIYRVPHVEADAGAPVQFTSIDDSPAQGIAYDAANDVIYIGTQHGIYSLPASGGTAPTKIASVRTGGIPAHSDGDVHSSTSVAVSGAHVYASVGSSCNACTEIDSTRAVVLEMGLDGSNLTTKATRIRNAIALAVNPATGTVWAGGAGQDNLALGHPYEFFDALTLHSGTADYGWPACEENQHAYVSGSDCSNTVAPLIEFPAYSTLIGAVFYPANQTGAHAFPAVYRGLYVAGHGSWHQTNGEYYSPPRVNFVAISGDAPATAVNWQDPSAQWSAFVDGFQKPDGVTRIGRPTGIAVGVEGSLFVADDYTGHIYRIRPR